MPGKRDPWVTGQQVPGVTLPYNSQVEIVSGPRMGERGWLVAVDARGAEPLYTVDMLSRAPDVDVPQSWLRLVAPTEISVSKVATQYAALRLRALTTSESGRRTPFAGRPHNGAAYMPHVRLSPGSEYLGVAFVDGPEWIYPGDAVEAAVALMYVDTGVDYGPLVVGVSLDVVEGTRVVARGEVLRRWSEPGNWHPPPSA